MSNIDLIFSLSTFFAGTVSALLFLFVYLQVRTRTVKYFLILQLLFLIQIVYDIICRQLDSSPDMMLSPILPVLSYLFLFLWSGLVNYPLSAFLITLSGFDFSGKIRKLYLGLSLLIMISAIFPFFRKTPAKTVESFRILSAVFINPVMIINFFILLIFLIIRTRKIQNKIIKIISRMLFILSLIFAPLALFLDAMNIFFHIDLFPYLPPVYETFLLSWNLSTIILFIIYVKKTGQASASSRVPETFFQKQKRNAVSISASITKYEKSGLSETEAAKYRKKIVDLMEEQELFLDPDLSLSKLAKISGISRNHISQIMSQYMKCSFYDFINTYRIRKSKEMLCDPDSDMSILEIAFESGFNAKATFYSAFKKTEKISPSEFRKDSAG